MGSDWLPCVIVIGEQANRVYLTAGRSAESIVKIAYQIPPFPHQAILR